MSLSSGTINIPGGGSLYIVIISLENKQQFINENLESLTVK